MVSELGDRIRQARKKMGYRQADLAEKIGISGAAIGAMEVGKSKPTLENLLKISDLCEVDLIWLIKGKGQNKLSTESIEKYKSDLDYKLELEKVTEENEHLKQQIRALTRAINTMPQHLGKDEVIDRTARLLKIPIGSMTQPALHM